MITGQNNIIICSIFYAIYSNLKSRLFMRCSGFIVKITTDLHLVLILLCQVCTIATRRLVKQDNGRPTNLSCRHSRLIELSIRSTEILWYKIPKEDGENRRMQGDFHFCVRPWSVLTISNFFRTGTDKHNGILIGFLFHRIFAMY